MREAGERRRKGDIKDCVVESNPPDVTTIPFKKAEE